MTGPGLIDCRLYRQPDRLVLHLVNLSHEGAVRGPVHELVPLGPLSLRVQLPAGAAGGDVRLLVAGESATARVEDTWTSFEVRSAADHEVAVIA